MTGNGPSLPYELQVGRFLEGRSQEITALTNDISKSSKTGKLASQQVPRHMRRRAVSHNPARLPRRLRPAHISQRNKSDDPVISVKNTSCPKKINSRRHRRRPSNLLEEYNRRQRNAVWLETHIWHAKRFHMETMWGSHKVPIFPNDKCWRACYRAASSKCLMWDQSYLQLIQLTGPDIDNLLDKLNLLTNQVVGQVFCDGPGEREVVLYSPGKFPHGVIGPVRYMWKPPAEGSKRMIWLWVPPSFHDTLVSVLTQLFSLSKHIENNRQEPDVKKMDEDNPNHDNDCPEPDIKKMKMDNSNHDEKNVNYTKLQPKLVPPVVLSSHEQIEMTLLKNCLNRFRLVGPLSSAVLGHSLVPASLDGTSDDKWWNSFYSPDQSKVGHSARSDLWAKWSNSVPRSIGSSILGLVVRDPRLILPPQRNKVKLEVANVERDGNSEDSSWELQESPIWYKEVRSRVTLEKESDFTINKLRSESLVPGTPLELGERESRMPILCIEQAGGEGGWGAGFDVVIPTGWAMNFWVCMIFAGGRVAGLRELGQFQMERRGAEHQVWEDAEWGQKEVVERLQHQRDVHFRLPPDKRVNPAVLGVSSPFTRPWDHLLREWAGVDSEDTGDWFVLRDQNILSNLKVGIIDDIREVTNKALVVVKLKLEGRGRLSEQTMINLPNLCDRDEEEPQEPRHKDIKQGERKEAREMHKRKKKRLKRQWKKVKEKQVLKVALAVSKDEEPDKCLLDKLSTSVSNLKKIRDEENKEYLSRNENLWLGKADTVRRLSSRQLMGWVIRGGYSYRVGGEVGMGLITLKGYLDWFERFRGNLGEAFILTREASSLQYRRAKMDIIC